MSAELLVVGLSHHTAPLAIRERLAIATERLAAALTELASAEELAEVMLISTCNRVEVYATATDVAAGVRRARSFLEERARPDQVASHLYERLGAEATRHAFRVAASLDSMVVGEPQILGQVKQAYSSAESSGTLGTLLGRCFHRAFAVAKRVRSETEIASGAVSVSSIAIELAQKIFGDLRRRRTLLLGAGKMGETAARTLAKQGAVLTVINRNAERAIELAGACGGEPKEWEQLTEELVSADVVITSTASPRFVITDQMMHEVVRVRRRRPLFLIDIAVPRDVDPRVGDMDNVFLYDVDDLQKVAAENLALRRREADAAEHIVMVEVAEFEAWRRTLTLSPTITELRQRFAVIVRAEVERTLPRLSSLSERERKSVDAMTDAIVNKLLHQPLTQLKKGQSTAESAALIAAARRLFDLSGEAAKAANPEGEPVSTDAHEVAEGSTTPALRPATSGRGGRGT